MIPNVVICYYVHSFFGSHFCSHFFFKIFTILARTTHRPVVMVLLRLHCAVVRFVTINSLFTNYGHTMVSQGIHIATIYQKSIPITKYHTLTTTSTLSRRHNQTIKKSYTVHTTHLANYAASHRRCATQ